MYSVTQTRINKSNVTLSFLKTSPSQYKDQNHSIDSLHVICNKSYKIRPSHDLEPWPEYLHFHANKCLTYHTW